MSFLLTQQKAMGAGPHSSISRSQAQSSGKICGYNVWAPPGAEMPASRLSVELERNKHTTTDARQSSMLSEAGSRQQLSFSSAVQQTLQPDWHLDYQVEAHSGQTRAPPSACHSRLLQIRGASTAAPVPERLILALTLDVSFQTVDVLQSAAVAMVAPQGISYSAQMLRFADALLRYGAHAGFRQLMDGQNARDLLEVIPFFCRGLTLGERECAALLADSEVLPACVPASYLSVCFKRALFLQGRLLQKPPKRGEKAPKEAFPAKSGARLCYFGCLFLFYAAAEAIELRKAQKRSEKYPRYQTALSSFQQLSYLSLDFDDEQDAERGWEVAETFSTLLDHACAVLEPFGMLDRRPFLTPDLSEFPGCDAVLASHKRRLRECFQDVASPSGLISMLEFCRVLALSQLQELLAKDFVGQVVLRNAKAVDKDTMAPALDFQRFQICLFVCANYAFCREPFVRKLRKPDSRLQFLLEHLRWRGDGA